MKHTIYWYCVTYPDNSQQIKVVDDPSDTVQFFYNNGKENYPYFESEAYHLLSWCRENGFDYKSGTQELTIPVKKI
jgi:hypothetical protein